MADEKSGKLLSDILLDAMCKASHDARRRECEDGYRMAIQAKCDEWALLFKGYIYLWDEKYKLIDASLDGFLTNPPKVLSATHSYNVNYTALCYLLMAHAKRRKAEEFLNWRWKPSGVKVPLKKVTRLLGPAAQTYESLSGNQECDSRVRAVAFHGRGIVEGLWCEIEEIRHMRKKCVHNPEPRWASAFALFSQSAKISEHNQLSYSPPYNRLAYIESWRSVRAHRMSRPIEEHAHLVDCIRYARRATELSREDGEPTYAPPLLAEARVLYFQAMNEKDRAANGETIAIPWEDIRRLLQNAVRCSPFDTVVRKEIESFAAALPKETKRDLSIYRSVRLAQPITATEAVHREYFRPKNGERVDLLRDQFTVMRRWSSYTPLLAKSDHDTIGGGYLLECQGSHIAIDPGVGFVRNMHRLGYNLCQLNAVVVTHQHVDHTADLEAILGVLKEYSKVAEKVPEYGLEEKKVHFFFSESGYVRWAKLLLQNLDKLKEIPFPMYPNKKVPCTKYTELTPVPVFGHLDIVEEPEELPPTGVGLRFRVKSGDGTHVLGITSDTGYVNADGCTLSRYYSECDTLVIHVSTIADLSAWDKEQDPDFDRKFIRHRSEWQKDGCPDIFYRKHLGFWGTACLIRDLTVMDRARREPKGPRTILLAEFGEEMLASRFALLDEIRSLIEPFNSKQAERIFLADVGTRVSLPDGKLLCQFGDNACPELAVKSFETELHEGEPWMSHRRWSDRAIVHLCGRHSEYASTPALWKCFGLPETVHELK